MAMSQPVHRVVSSFDMVLVLLGYDAAKPLCADDRPERPALVVCLGPVIAHSWRCKCCAAFGLPVKRAIVLGRRPGGRSATCARTEKGKIYV